MKTIEELKQEQHELKARLHEVIDLTNSDEYFSLPDEQKGLINQQRVGMEMYLSSLTKRIYGKKDIVNSSNLIWMSLLYGMLNTSSGFGSSSTDCLKQQLEEKDSGEKDKLYTIPV